jgi:hypothetical protein
MSKFRLAVCTGFAASALLLIPPASASAHVHGVTPLRCTPAPLNAGGNQIIQTPASAANGGPISPGPIPVTMGGNIKPGEGGFDGRRCLQRFRPYG